MTAGATPVADDLRPDLSGLIRLAGPVVASRLGIMAMGFVDTVVVGRYSAEQVAFHTLAWSPTGVVLTTSIGLLAGVQVMTSQAIGEGRAADTGAILRRGCAYALWTGLAAALLLALFGGPALHLAGLDPALADGATPVLQLFALSLLPILVGDVGMFWLEAHNRPMPGVAAMWAANLVNLALNLWLVPGTSGLPVSGAMAAACATFASRLVFLALVAAAIIRWDKAAELGVFAPAPTDKPAMRAMRQVGYGSAGSYFIESAAFSLMAIFAGWLGAVAVASWAVIINMAALVFMVPLGLATATSVLVGRSFGARDLAGMKSAARLGFWATAAALALISVGIALAPHAVAALYSRDNAVIEMTAAALLLSCLFFVADGLQVVAGQSLRARSDVLMPTVTHSFSYLVVMIPLAWWLALPQGMAVAGLVWAIIIASLISAGLLWGRFWWLARRPLSAALG
ncbi:MAG: MATE family efflux transporter [Sphingomonadales bacterium]